MNETPETPETRPSRRRRKWRHQKFLITVLSYAMPIIIAGVVGGFGYFLLRGPGEKVSSLPSVELSSDPTSPEVTAIKPASVNSLLLGTTAKPKAKPKAPTPEAPITLTAAQVAQMEIAALSQASGPLYDARSANMAIQFEKLPLDTATVVDAGAILRAYLQTKDYRERVAFVYDPEKCEPLMKQHYEQRGEKDPLCGQVLGAGYMTAGGSKVLCLVVECATRPDSGMRANFHFTKTGKLMLDWESWAAWCEMSWADLKKERPQRSVLMRAVASESHYYNYEFGEEWRWLAVKLRSADGLQHVTGYVPRDSAAGVAMASIIGVLLPHDLPPDAPLPPMRGLGSKSVVTVRLAFPPNAQSDHCVKISELVADRWLLFPGEGK
jgi:nitrate reductase NapE component